jgi:hypothetical protein
MGPFDWQSFYLDESPVEGGHAKEAKFSIFDSPDEVEQALEAEKPKEPEKPDTPEGSQWEQFLEQFYEGGKKKVQNPNPKTSDKYPEVQVSTALHDPVFAGKVKKEYEAWLAQQAEPKDEATPPEPEPPKEEKKPEKKLKPKVGDQITSTDQLQPGVYIQNDQGVVGRITSMTSDGGFRYKRWLPTGWSEVSTITKEQAESYFSHSDFVVTDDPAKAVPKGSKPTVIQDVVPGDYVWFNGDRRKVKRVEEDPDKYGLRVQLEDGTWVNQTYLDTTTGVTHGSHVYVEKGEPEAEEPKQEEPKQEEPKQEEPKQEEPKQEEPKQEEPKAGVKAKVGDKITRSDQLEAGDWIRTVDPDEPSSPYVGQIVEVVGTGVMVQDFSPTTGKLLGKPWLLKEEMITDPLASPTEKIEPPKKIKKPLAGKPVTDPKKLQKHDVLRIHDYATGDVMTAVVVHSADGNLGLTIVSAKTGKVKGELIILADDFDGYQIHRMPASKVPKALQPPKEDTSADPFSHIIPDSLEKKIKEKTEAKAEQAEAEPEEPEKAEEKAEEKPKTKTKAVDSKKWQLKTEQVSWDDIKPDDMVHTQWGPQRVVSRTSTGVRLDSGIVLTKSQLEKEKGKYLVSRGDKPQRATPPKPPERPSGAPVTSADQVHEGDVIEYEHNGVTYRGEVMSWDEPGVKFRVKIIYPPEQLGKYQSYDESTGEMKHKTPSFDFEKIKKRKPRILSKEAMKEFDAEVKKYTARIKEIDQEYAEDVAEYEAAMAGKKEVETGPLKHVQPPESWNHESSIARDADRFFEQYRTILGDEIKDMVAGMSSGQSYWTGPSAAWADMSEGERKLAQSAHLAAVQFRKLLTDEEWSAWEAALSTWQGSSGGGTAHRLMGGLENLGVEGGPKYFETANVQHYRQAGREDESLHRAISKAMAYSQLVYEALGVTHVHLYRGTKTKPVQGAKQGKKIQTTTARELASFSIDPSVAYSFAGSDKRVVRYRVPISRLFVSPVTYAPLSSAKPPHSENEYVVAGQDGMEGKVMPSSSSGFDPEQMKLGSEDDTPLIIAFSDFEDDWLRPGVIELWWDTEAWQRDHEIPLFRVARRLVALAKEHPGFRRELIAALRPRRAMFSIFDAPEEVEKKRSPNFGKMTFESWYERRYDGGKKKVQNPNPKTSERYPEVATSTAMKDEGFAAKVYAEYQQEMSEGRGKIEPEKPETPPERPKPPDTVERGVTLTWDESDLGPIQREVDDVYLADDGQWVIRDTTGVEWNYSPKMKIEEPKIEEPKVEELMDLDSGDFTQVGPQTGSNPGGLYEGSDGGRYYVKTPATEDRARNEILAGRLYGLAGIDVPDLSPATRDGKFSVASKIIPGLKRNKAKLKSGEVPGVVEGIAVDAWLGNWDVVGLEYDNLLVDEEGRGRRVDTGGALRYRAMGEPKGDKFGPEVTELETFTDPDRRAGGVLGHATPKQIVESIDRVLGIPETKIRALVHQWGPKDDKERAKLLDVLMARRESLRKQRERYAEKIKAAAKIARMALHNPMFRRQLMAEAARMTR